MDLLRLEQSCGRKAVSDIDAQVVKASLALDNLPASARCEVLAEVLIRCFPWADTSQGKDYWEGVYKALQSQAVVLRKRKHDY